jgi:hypothetical protein
MTASTALSTFTGTDDLLRMYARGEWALAYACVHGGGGAKNLEIVRTY